MGDGKAHAFLVFRIRTSLGALPLAHVIETMRPLPTEPVAGAPGFVRGVALIRGTPVPVVDAARLLGAEEDAAAGRFVSLAVGGRRVALALSSVLGVRALAQASLHRLPPLLDRAGAELVAAIGLLDAELLWVLQSARLLPDGEWAEGLAPGAPA